jgi:hypothetical protein
LNLKNIINYKFVDILDHYKYAIIVLIDFIWKVVISIYRMVN